MKFRFPVKGSEEYVNKQITEWESRGFKAIGKPKRIPSGSLKTMPTFIVMMEGEKTN